MRQRERVTFNQVSTSNRKISAGLAGNRKSTVHRTVSRIEKLLDLQRTHGNAFVQRLVQRKLAVGRPGDNYERKADRVADAVIREKNASSSMPGITRYEQPGVHSMCPECREEIEHREVAGKQAVQEEELQAMPRPEMKNEVARANTLSGRSYEAVLQKQKRPGTAIDSLGWGNTRHHQLSRNKPRGNIRQAAWGRKQTPGHKKTIEGSMFR
jgi:hypothetical protein